MINSLLSSFAQHTSSDEEWLENARESSQERQCSPVGVVFRLHHTKRSSFVAIPFHHLAQVSNKRQLLQLPNGSLFWTTTDFYSSAKFSNAIFDDYYVYICHFNYSV